MIGCMYMNDDGKTGLSNFEKRKLKEIEAKRTKIRETKMVEPNLSRFAIDVYRLPDSNKYSLAIIKYDPLTKKAEVVEVKGTNRTVGLMFQHKKEALKTLAHINEKDL